MGLRTKMKRSGEQPSFEHPVKSLKKIGEGLNQNARSYIIFTTDIAMKVFAGGFARFSTEPGKRKHLVLPSTFFDRLREDRL